MEHHPSLVRAALALFALIALGVLMRWVLPTSSLTIAYTSVLAVVVLASTTIILDAQWLEPNAMEAGGLRTIRLFTAAACIAFSGAVTYISLGALVPNELGGIWQFSDAVTGVSAALAGTAMAGLGFVYGSTEDRISRAGTTFVQSHRRILSLIRDYDDQMEAVWSNYSDLVSELGSSVLRALRSNSGVVNWSEVIEERNSVVPPVSLSRVAEVLQSALERIDTGPRAFEAFDWPDELRDSLKSLRHQGIGLSMLPAPSIIPGVFPVDTEFLAEKVLKRASIVSRSIVKTPNINDILQAAYTVGSDFLRQSQRLLDEARRTALALAEQTSDLPLRVELLIDDLLLINTLVRYFDEPSRTNLSSRDEAAAVRFLSYATTFEAAREAVSGDWWNIRPSCNPQTGYCGYLQAAVQQLGGGSKAGSRHIPEIESAQGAFEEFSSREEHPIAEIAVFTQLMKGFLTSEIMKRRLSAIALDDHVLDEDDPASGENRLLLAMAADMTYSKSPLRNWTRVARSIGRRGTWLSRDSNESPLSLLDLAADKKPWPVLRVEQRKSPDEAWKVLAQESGIALSRRPDTLRVAPIASLMRLRQSDPARDAIRRIKLGGMEYV